MTFLDIRRAPRTLYIIAPTLQLCHRTAIEHGFTPPFIEHHRNITRAYELRGTSPGTPFITFGREHWADTPAGFDLDEAVAVYQRTGRLRIAQPDDLAACRPYDGLPSRTMPSTVARAGL